MLELSITGQADLRPYRTRPSVVHHDQTHRTKMVLSHFSKSCGRPSGDQFTPAHKIRELSWLSRTVRPRGSDHRFIFMLHTKPRLVLSITMADCFPNRGGSSSAASLHFARITSCLCKTQRLAGRLSAYHGRNVHRSLFLLDRINSNLAKSMNNPPIQGGLSTVHCALAIFKTHFVIFLSTFSNDTNLSACNAIIWVKCHYIIVKANGHWPLMIVWLSSLLIRSIIILYKHILTGKIEKHYHIPWALQSEFIQVIIIASFEAHFISETNLYLYLQWNC